MSETIICRHVRMECTIKNGALVAACPDCGFMIQQAPAAELSALRALRDAVGKYIADPDAWDHALKEAYARVAKLEKGGER